MIVRVDLITLLVRISLAIAFVLDRKEPFELGQMCRNARPRSDGLRIASEAAAACFGSRLELELIDQKLYLPLRSPYGREDNVA